MTALAAPGERDRVRRGRTRAALRRRILDFLPTAVVALGAVALGTASLAAAEWRMPAFLLGAAATVGGSIWQFVSFAGARRTEDLWLGRYLALQTYERELAAELDLLRAPRAELATFFLRQVLADLGIAGHRSRASVYIRVQEEFVLLARYSEDALLRTPGRARYTPANGAVARGWSAPYVDTGLPADRAKWEQRMRERYGIAPDVARGLRMHSRALTSVPVTAHAGVTPETVGVLLVEHLDRGAITAATQDQLMSMVNLPAIGALCQAHMRHADLVARRPADLAEPRLEDSRLIVVDDPQLPVDAARASR